MAHKIYFAIFGDDIFHDDGNHDYSVKKIGGVKKLLP
jgi:hypothetical protein